MNFPVCCFFLCVHPFRNRHSACCNYVQVSCKLLTDGGDDRKNTAKTESRIYVNFFPKQMPVVDIGKRREKPCKHFYRMKRQRELATSGQEAHVKTRRRRLFSGDCHDLQSNLLLLTYGKIHLSDTWLVVIIFIT